MKRLWAALLYFVPLLLQGQDKEIYFSAAPPEFIPYGKSFELYTTLKFPETDFDKICFYIMSDSRFSLQDVSIYNSYNSVRVRPEETNYADYSAAYKISFSSSDSIFDFSNIFRIKFSFAQVYENGITINYAADFIKNGRVIKSFTSFDKDKALASSSVNFYKPQQVSGKCLLLQDDAVFSLSVDSPGSRTNLLAEFWAKASNISGIFFSIAGKYGGRNIFSLGLNENSFVYLNDFSKAYYSGLSLSKNAWNHFAVYFVNNRIRLYLNGRMIYENTIAFQFKEEELKLSFLNESSESGLYVKNLRLWNFQEDIEKCFAGRQYSFYSSERSELLYQNLFNDEITSDGTGPVTVSELTHTRIVQSDAPIISRAPEINISVFSSYCSVEWYSRDNQPPKNFIVEKSTDGINFYEIFRTTADEDLSKVYYYSDKRDEYGKVTYYRVKQINYDGAEIYSSSLKVGQSARKEKVKLSQNYPNPFNPSTSFTVEMTETADAAIIVYDLVGQKIKTLFEGALSQGTHVFNFDGSSLPSGLYFYEIKTPSSSVVKKMVLTK